MKNQVYTGTPTSRRQVTLPTTVKAGDPLLVGKEPAVALDDYQSAVAGATCFFGGTFTLTVIGQSAESPQTGAAVKPGDKIYANGGTLDTATNVTTGFVLDVNTGGTLFGYLDPSGVGITSTATDAAAIVRLAGAE